MVSDSDLSWTSRQKVVFADLLASRKQLICERDKLLQACYKLLTTSLNRNLVNIVFLH